MAQGRKKTPTPESETQGIVKINPTAVENAFGSSQSFNYGGVGTTSRTRRGKALTGGIRFANIRAGISPFEEDGFTVSVADALYLCQKAYWNVPIFKNTIDIMSEFSNSEIHWEGGNKASRDFFKALDNKLNGWNFRDQFFREYYRGGNVHVYRFDGSITKQEAKKITQVYNPEDGEEITANTIKLPIRYVLLNPVDIRAGANISFADSNIYFKVLNSFEASRLKNPTTDEEKELFDSLTPEQKTTIKQGGQPVIQIDPKRLHSVFYKKQDYEPLAIPMGYCVLDDIDMKLELKKMDRVILRTVESTILLITMGDEPGKGGVNPEAIKAMKEIFNSETVGRVLVADYTTKVSFVIPELNKVLGPEKYAIINEDIANGLNNIFWGEQKFANAMVKIKVFVERLKDGRDAYLNGFLIPEVKRLAKLMGFKTYPKPVFKEVDLQDEIELSKMISRLAEIGVLTPDETIEAIKSGVLPTPEDSEESQQKTFEKRQKGHYAPLTGPMPKTYDQEKKEKEDDRKAKAAQQAAKVAKQAGRPKGTKSKQTTKKVKPIGTKAAFSIASLKELTFAADMLVKSVEESLKVKHQLTELNPDQKEAAASRALTIMENEQKGEWLSKINDYISGDVPINEEACAKIDEIEYEHQLSRLAATLLYHSEVNVSE